MASESSATIKEELISNIKKWILLDSDIVKKKADLKILLAEKRQITNALVFIMKNNAIECVDIKGGALLYKQRKTKQAISAKYLLSQMNDYFKNDSDIAKEITDKLLNNRNETIVEEIRRK